MSLEKEVYPYMAKEGALYAFDLEGIHTATPPSVTQRLHVVGSCGCYH